MKISAGILEFAKKSSRWLHVVLLFVFFLFCFVYDRLLSVWIQLFLRLNDSPALIILVNMHEISPVI